MRLRATSSLFLLCCMFLFSCHEKKENTNKQITLDELSEWNEKPYSLSSRKIRHAIDSLRLHPSGVMYADKYTDYGGRWIAIVDLARDFGTDYGSLLSGMRHSFIQMSDIVYDKLNVAYISDFIKAGDPLPLEYCKPEIKGILIGIRRHKLVTDLEQDLLKDAREKGKFVIY